MDQPDTPSGLSQAAHEDQSLILAAQQDPNAFAPLYQKYVDRLFQFIYYRVGQNRELAEDCTAEVFTRAFARITEFEWRGYPYSAYLYSIARSICQVQYKKQPTVNLEDVVIVDEKYRSVIVQADVQLLWQAIRTLSPEVQEVMELRFLDDLSYDEIGEIVGKKAGAIRTQVSRTIDSLQAIYAPTH